MSRWCNPSVTSSKWPLLATTTSLPLVQQIKQAVNQGRVQGLTHPSYVHPYFISMIESALHHPTVFVADLHKPRSRLGTLTAGCNLVECASVELLFAHTEDVGALQCARPDFQDPHEHPSGNFRTTLPGATPQISRRCCAADQLIIPEHLCTCHIRCSPNPCSVTWSWKWNRSLSAGPPCKT